ncbi:hypothetical protein [Candidatus Villigracilis affinis]|uniref:hypothetical protein n=1 Tax=Candidatus Villigracilis affinis TaxID=3140682 RepID=UPI0031E99D15
MSAPVIWILVPFLAGVLILFLLQERVSSFVGGVVSMLLALTALIFPIDTALLLGTVSIKISASVQFFGRSFALNTADGPLLAIIYGLATLWFFGTQASGTANRFVSLGLMIVALLTASIAVEPFLFAALLITMAAMLVIPLLVPLHQRPGSRHCAVPHPSNSCNAIHPLFGVDACRRGSQPRRHRQYHSSRHHAQSGICLPAGGLSAL